MDKTIKCCDCGIDFLFTYKEQNFYTSNNFTEPKRCKSCREIKKAKFEGQGGYYKYKY